MGKRGDKNRFNFGEKTDILRGNTKKTPERVINVKI